MPRLLCLLLAACVAAPVFAQYGESITVSRVIFDVRVTEADGEPVADLTPADFTVELGGAPAEVVSASWIAEGAIAHARPKPRLQRNDEGERVLRATADPDEPRLIVLFVQTDFARNTVRVGGQMKFRSYAEELVRSFAPNDRVAVFSFDSHLKFRSDLTANKDEAIQAFRDSILIDTPPPPLAVDEPSLALLLDRDEMRRATSSEQGLLLVANALKNLPGAKTLFLLGWGLGDFANRKVVMKREWNDAWRAMEEARVTMISLDTTDAGHDLAAGLNTAAVQTGGFYAAAAQNPHLALQRVQGTLKGRYELELISSKPLDPGTHSITVRVNRKKVEVLAPAAITISVSQSES
jgi:VWFA-related protein